MLRLTQIYRLDGNGGTILCETTGDNDDALRQTAAKVKKIIRTITPTSAPSASIASPPFTIYYSITSRTLYLAICDASFPKSAAFLYLSDIASSFQSQHPESTYIDRPLPPYPFQNFDNYMQQAKKSYQDARAVNAGGFEKLNGELKDVTTVMQKNIEDLLYRGDSLERMGDMSGRLREESRKYRKAAVRINWELLLKQYGPLGGVGLIMVAFIYWRFF